MGKDGHVSRDGWVEMNEKGWVGRDGHVSRDGWVRRGVVYKNYRKIDRYYFCFRFI